MKFFAPIFILPWATIFRYNTKFYILWKKNYFTSAIFFLTLLLLNFVFWSIDDYFHKLLNLTKRNEACSPYISLPTSTIFFFRKKTSTFMQPNSTPRVYIFILQCAHTLHSSHNNLSPTCWCQNVPNFVFKYLTAL